MRPIFFSVGGLPVYSYGTLIALGFFIAYVYISWLCKKRGEDEDVITDIFLVIIISSIISARLTYVTSHLSEYSADPTDVFRVWKGGMTYLGGFLGALAGAWVYLRWKGLPFGLFADMFAPGVALAQVLGRLGCFMNGCCYGLRCEPGHPLALVFPSHPEPRHPFLATQLIEALILTGLFWALSRHYYRNRVHGMTMLMYFYLYSAQRFLIEFVRQESTYESYLFGLTLAQSTAILMVAGAFVVQKTLVEKPKGDPAP